MSSPMSLTAPRSASVRSALSCAPVASGRRSAYGSGAGHEESASIPSRRMSGSLSFSVPRRRGRDDCAPILPTTLMSEIFARFPFAPGYAARTALSRDAGSVILRDEEASARSISERNDSSRAPSRSSIIAGTSSPPAMRFRVRADSRRTAADGSLAPSNSRGMASFCSPSIRTVPASSVTAFTVRVDPEVILRSPIARINSTFVLLSARGRRASMVSFTPEACSPARLALATFCSLPGAREAARAMELTAPASPIAPSVWSDAIRTVPFRLRSIPVTDRCTSASLYCASDARICICDAGERRGSSAATERMPAMSVTSLKSFAAAGWIALSVPRSVSRMTEAAFVRSERTIPRSAAERTGRGFPGALSFL